MRSAMLGSLRPRAGERLVHDLAEIDRFSAQRQPAALHPHQLAQIGDQPFHPARLLENGGDGRLVVGLAPLQQLRPGAEHGDRSEQVVAGHRDEILLHALGPLALGDVADRGDHRHPLSVADEEVGAGLDESLAAVRMLDARLVAGRRVGVGKDGVVLALPPRPAPPRER